MLKCIRLLRKKRFYFMNYEIYTTEAIAINKVISGESDMIFWLLTDKLGLITAKAIGFRKESGKMRNRLQLFSHVTVSLVRGRNNWRIVGVQDANFFQLGNGNHCFFQEETLRVFARISQFICRMTMTNTSDFGDSHLFDILLACGNKLLSAQVKKGDDNLSYRIFNEIEIETVAEILVSLGYLQNNILQKFRDGTMSTQTLLKYVNESIACSHM